VPMTASNVDYRLGTIT